MFFKLIGGILLIFSAISASRALVGVEKRRLRQTDSFIALIRYIRDRIDCYSTPIDKILSTCPEDILFEISGGGELSFKDLAARNDIVLDGEGKRVLIEFSGSLGKNYRDRQIKLCDAAISSLEKYRKDKADELAVKKKAINAVCLAISGITVVALL